MDELMQTYLTPQSHQQTPPLRMHTSTWTWYKIKGRMTRFIPISMILLTVKKFKMTWCNQPSHGRSKKAIKVYSIAHEFALISHFFGANIAEMSSSTSQWFSKNCKRLSGKTPSHFQNKIQQNLNQQETRKEKPKLLMMPAPKFLLHILKLIIY